MRSVPNPSRVEAAIHAAERRRVLVLAAEEAAIAAAVLLGGVILLLLFGAQILHWYWAALVAGAAGILVVLRVRASVPLERYRLAQILDWRLGLSDSLSTAWFLLNGPRREDPFARFQLAHAEAIACRVRPARAFPFSGRRKWAASGALAAVACGLFGVRYLVTQSLSLEPALLPIHLEPVLEAVEEAASGARSKLSAALSSGGRAEIAQAAQSQQHEKNARASMPEQSSSGDPAGAAAGTARTQSGSSRRDGTETGEGKTPGGQLSSGEKEQQNGADAAQRQSAEAKEEPTPAQQGSSGVLDKMKDALSSLMAKMRASAGQSAARQGERSEANQRAGDQTALGKDERGNQPNAPTTQAAEQQSTQGEAQGQTTEQSAQSRNEAGDRKGDGSQSGAGHQDGDKAVKEAEQQQAMGKLAEIIGKRSANLTGDMTVESRGGKQQLKTEYSQRAGRHSDAGGEINRDEIPFEYQQYIRDYMEAVRKQQRP